MSGHRNPYYGKSGKPWDKSERWKAVERMRERMEEKYGVHDEDRQVDYQGDPEACVGLCQYYRSRGLPNPFEDNTGMQQSQSA